MKQRKLEQVSQASQSKTPINGKEEIALLEQNLSAKDIGANFRF